jgi:hypothetical protein
MPTAFVIMPFRAELDEVYKHLIEPTLSTVGYDVVRADNIANQRNILSDIVAGIEGADLIIADLTDPNPNVYYELGIAHARLRPVILLTQSIESLPFDLQGYRAVPYGTNFIEADRMREQLAELASHALTGDMQFGNPVSDYLKAEIRFSKASAGSQLSAFGEDTTKGVLDHLVDIEEGTEQLTRLIEEVGEANVRLSSDMKKASLQIAEIAESPIQGRTKRIRSVAWQLAKKLRDFHDSHSEFNEHFDGPFEQMQEGLEGYLVFIQKGGDLTAEQAIDGKGILMAAKSAAINVDGLIKSTTELRIMLKGFKGTESQLTLAVNQLAVGMKEYEARLTRSRALFDRVAENLASTLGL